MKHKPVGHECFCNVLMALTRGPDPLCVHGFAPCVKCLFFTLPTGGTKNWNCSYVELMDAETCETEELSIILTPAVTSGRERVAQQARLKVSNPDTPWAWTSQFWHPQPCFSSFPRLGKGQPHCGLQPFQHGEENCFLCCKTPGKLVPGTRGAVIPIITFLEQRGWARGTPVVPSTLTSSGLPGFFGRQKRNAFVHGNQEYFPNLSVGLPWVLRLLLRT